MLEIPDPILMTPSLREKENRALSCERLSSEMLESSTLTETSKVHAEKVLGRELSPELELKTKN
jgi:hypothetical protein